MADVYVNALTTISTEPTTTDSLVAVNRNTNEGKIIDYNKLADVILNKLTSKTYSGLNTTSKLLVGAINELDSDITSVDDKFSNTKMFTMTVNNGVLKTFTLSANFRGLLFIMSNADTRHAACFVYANGSGAAYYVPIQIGSSVTISRNNNNLDITVDGAAARFLFVDAVGNGTITAS